MANDSSQMLRQIVTILVLLVGLTFLGALGFHLTTDVGWFDSVYYAVITVTTLGYQQPDNFSNTGKLFVIFYLIGGLGVFSFSAFQLGQWVVSAQFRAYREQRRMEKRIAEMHNHFIICGCGRMGTTIAKQMELRDQQFVILDSNQELLDDICHTHNWAFLAGDATDDEILLKAGIQRARGLASVLPTDADNVYVVLSARMLMSDLQITARASNDKAVLKLERAGATRVVSPFSSGAQKMARFMLNPRVEDFLEIADTGGMEFELADVHIEEESPYVGLQLNQADLREKGAMVVGIRRADGERLMPPPGDAEIRIGDCLFVFGNSQAVSEITGNPIKDA
ncbi:Voltage-gated potassium channel Kch [Polystyrenella longa]|uniref:Voltage-gated potassium channel Kch n=1 Tax=Polystyrenella longa TaxID=2528007 RepID=A0A518CJ92_9PLAN|nr:potassium channel protein [Polystyrenella longa]QDU79267.1 Voltage-gated potassium channel Kch [Polystyrenella longa]